MRQCDRLTVSSSSWMSLSSIAPMVMTSLSKLCSRVRPPDCVTILHLRRCSVGTFCPSKWTFAAPNLADEDKGTPNQKLLWRVWYYGSYFPNTYYTKVAYLSFYARGWSYLTKYLELDPNGKDAATAKEMLKYVK